MRSRIRQQPLGSAVRLVLAALLTFGVFLISASLAAQEVEPEPADGAEMAAGASDVWLLAETDEVALYSSDGEPLGVAAPGTWFKSVLQEDGWALVYAEDNPELMVWIALEAVVSVALAAQSPAGPAPTDPSAEPPQSQVVEAPTPEPTIALIPTAIATSIGTATPGPSATPAPTIAATSTVPTATAAPTVVPPTATRTSTPAPTQAPASASVNMQDNFFSPASVTIRVGGTVTWNETGAQPHSATRSAAPQNFDSGVKLPGASSFSWTFTQAGAFSYLCSVHGTPMSGTVIVQ